MYKQCAYMKTVNGNIWNLLWLYTHPSLMETDDISAVMNVYSCIWETQVFFRIQQNKKEQKEK